LERALAASERACISGAYGQFRMKRMLVFLIDPRPQTGANDAQKHNISTRIEILARALSRPLANLT